MKKILLLVLTSLCLIGCSQFDRPANVEIIGVGTVRSDAGLLVVEIDSVKYAPDWIYAGFSEKYYFKSWIPPIEGMPVTAFTMHNKPQVTFIAGERDKAYLEEYFFENHTADAVAMALFIIAWGIFIFLAIVAWKNQKNKTKKKG
ncbi:MAG: hypothetical protein J5895_04230 [Alphaproteobacteria bacterium]|nr:hypothetical protein [Alphaproteobacteria bacterium]